MNNPFQKQPQPTDNFPRTPEPTTPQPLPTTPTAPATAPNVTQTPVGSPAPGSPVGSGSGKTFHPPAQTFPSLGSGLQGSGLQGGPIYPAEAVDVQQLNNIIYPRNPLEDVRTLFSKQVIFDKNTTIQVDTITVPGYIGISDEFWVEDPKGNRVSGCADVAAILKTEDLLICTYQENPDTYGIPIDLSAKNDQSEEISGLVNRDISGSFKGTLDGLLSNIASNKSLGEFSGHVDLSVLDESTGAFGTKLKGTYEGTLQCWFEGTLQGQLKSTVVFEDELLKGTVIKNGGRHSCAMVPALKPPYYEADATMAKIETFACLEKSRDSTSGGYSGGIAIAQRLVFDEVITPAEATGYRHTMINWMGLLSHVVKFADRNIDGGDPTTVVDKATLKTILQNCVRASLGDPEALAFFDNSDNKLYCAEFVYIALNTPLFPFHQPGLTALLDGDSNAAKAILGNRARYNNNQLNMFSLVREPNGTNSELAARNILLPSVPETLSPLDQLLTERGRIVQGLPFPPFTITQVIRRAFRTLLPQPGTLEASKLAKLQVRLFQAIEPMLTQQVVLQAVDLSSLTEEAAAAIQAGPRVQQIKAFIAQVEETLTTITDIAELDKHFDEIVEQANTLVRQAGSIVEFVPPRIYVDLGQQDGDDNLPKGWGFKLQTIGAMIDRQSINGAVPPIVPPADNVPAEAAA
jgi:hypothetical protein